MSEFIVNKILGKLGSFLFDQLLLLWYLKPVILKLETTPSAPSRHCFSAQRRSSPTTTKLYTILMICLTISQLRA
ncbi:unnamed protein product [Linum trigynum]|uniref:Uncharacterized protein n=1 Tax=Linum trigynum TaxID=586398 RepID=A0AAV2GEQ7_9ROSI